MEQHTTKTTNRPPIVTIVGHINHGKSTLLQALREADLTLQEAGDITQHIGAYEITVSHEGNMRAITLIDTPGHAAFAHIRENGISIADIALLVISAEEGWKEQTSEAYRAIREADIPFLVVFTKTDTANADIERVKKDVLDHDILLESLGGTIPWVGVSAITRDGIASLLEVVLLTADLYEVTKQKGVITEKSPIGVTIEADIDAKSGIAATVIVQQGRIAKKQFVVVGGSVAPTRMMQNDKGEDIQEAYPSTPIRIIGFDTIPPIGEAAFLFDSKRDAVAKKVAWEEEKNNTQKIKEGERKTGCILPVILKADTAGGLTSVMQYIEKTSHPEVHFRVIKTGVGPITEDDITFAGTHEHAYIIGFHTTIDAKVKATIERLNVVCVIFSTVYEVAKWSQEICQQVLRKSKLQQRTGEATVIRLFQQQENQGVSICGMQVVYGTFHTGQKVLTQRGNRTIGEYTIETIEQHSKKQDSVTGEKEQFAAKFKGDTVPQLQDTVIGLPDAVTNTTTKT